MPTPAKSNILKHSFLNHNMFPILPPLADKVTHQSCLDHNWRDLFLCRYQSVKQLPYIIWSNGWQGSESSYMMNLCSLIRIYYIHISFIYIYIMHILLWHVHFSNNNHAESLFCCPHCIHHLCNHWNRVVSGKSSTFFRRWTYITYIMYLYVPWSKVAFFGDGRPPTFNDGILIMGPYITPNIGLMTIPYYMEIMGV